MVQVCTMLNEAWLSYHGTTVVVEPYLNKEGSNHGLFAMVRPCLNNDGIMVHHGPTIVEPWYRGRFCRGTPIY